VSEEILNGTLAQLDYTVPFTLVHDEKYRTEDKLEKNRQCTETKQNPEKSKQCKTQQNKTTLV